MPLESLDFNQINIKQLATEIPEKEKLFYFDPAKEITASHLADIESYLQNTLETNETWTTFLTCRGMLKTLLPANEQYGDNPSNVMDNFVRTTTEELLSEMQHSGKWTDYFGLLLATKWYDPKVFQQLIINHTMDATFQRAFNTYFTDQKLALIWEWKMVFPSQPFPKPLSPHDHNELWRESQEQFYGATQALDLFTQSSLAFNAKLVYPNRFPALGVTQVQYRQFYQELFQEPRSVGRWDVAIKNAFGLAVLSAQRIEFTQQGVHLINKPPETLSVQNVPPLPEVKKF